jgi:hypothetical protein
MYTKPEESHLKICGVYMSTLVLLNFLFYNNRWTYGRGGAVG